MSSIEGLWETFKSKPTIPLNFRLRKPRKRKEQTAVLKFLAQTEHGYAELKDIPHYHSAKTLVSQGTLLQCWLCFKKGVGSYKRTKDNTYFHEGFYNKTFICLNRTSLVRLFMDALREPKTFLARKRITCLCKKHLTHAEWIAVLWSLGIHSFSKSQLKRNMQVDGLYFPIKRYEEVSE